MSIKVRLVKVLVKPVFMLDYGDKLEEVDHDTIEISAIDWPIYSSDKFPNEVKQWEEKLNSIVFDKTGA